MAVVMSLREAIVKKVEGQSNEDLREIIEDSIGQDERALPGLGVLFETIWKQIDTNTQNQLIDALQQGLKAKPSS
ncbi:MULTISPECIES: small acid-soluble spore protein SspI [unclassified Paenibacillus]|uniref:small acid-soluble spore protein SspI n=1 Tax=unclassified Paenibacillus TaxID=185978 RepID=UPI001C108AE4|nr:MULTISPECIES: small acid-soluble spore protein SspI [unclassified Paenibacillus]MBU5441380.1 small acid-soluble spore protein SspI [Paenibacillus sp. MSJ-34]CAH0118246.1 Small, acid-soluble spore protein I [Paenibacillus sp. CECT 9249]